MIIVPRSGWGATAPLGPPMTLPARQAWLHHSVTTPSADPRADMRALERIGVQRFGRFSYSYAVHPDGTVLEGAGLTVGAHTANRNSTSFGIVWIGNYETNQPTRVQTENTAALIRHLIDSGHLINGAPIGGHRDVSRTLCPGRNAYARLPEIRELVTNPPPEDSMAIIFNNITEFKRAVREAVGAEFTTIGDPTREAVLSLAQRAVANEFETVGSRTRKALIELLRRELESPTGDLSTAMTAWAERQFPAAGPATDTSESSEP